MTQITWRLDHVGTYPPGHIDDTERDSLPGLPGQVQARDPGKLIRCQLRARRKPSLQNSGAEPVVAGPSAGSLDQEAVPQLAF